MPCRRLGDEGTRWKTRSACDREAVGGAEMQQRRRDGQKRKQEQTKAGREEEEVLDEVEMGTGTGWEVNIRRTR